MTTADQIADIIYKDVIEFMHDVTEGTDLSRMRDRWREIIHAMLTKESVQSSNIAAISRLGEKGMLIEFHGGGIYSYDEVPFALIEEFRQAPSKGKFFHAKVKGKFAYKKLTD